MRVGELIAVTAQAAVATRIAAAIAPDSRLCVSEHLVEHVLVFQLRDQPGATGHVVVQHYRGRTRVGAAGDRHVEVRIRDVQRLRRTEQHGGSRGSPVFAFRFRHVGAAGTTDMEPFAVPALAEDDQRSRHRFGDAYAVEGLACGLPIAPESLEERARRVQAPHPSPGLLGLLEDGCHETEHRGKVFRYPGGCLRVAFVPLFEISCVVILVMSNRPCFPQDCFDAAGLPFGLVRGDLSSGRIFGNGLR